MSKSAAARQHEEFDITNATMNDRVKIVRQDRISVEDLDCFVMLGDTKARVLDISAFGVAVQTLESVAAGTEFRNVTFSLENEAFSEVSLRAVRTLPNGMGSFTVGFEVMGEPIRVARMHAIQEAQTLINTQKTATQAAEAVPPEFRRRVLEIRDWLQGLRTEIENVSKSRNKENYGQDFESAFASTIADYLGTMMPAKNDELRHILPTSEPETMKASIEYFRTKLYDLIYDAPFSDRVYHKPLGYAGDYEMMNIIYMDAASGKDLFAKCLNTYWLNQPAAQAVRNRANYLMKHIATTFGTVGTHHVPKFLSVASGPAMEWQRMISETKRFNTQRASVHLLDQDEGALKHAQRQMKALSFANPTKFEFHYHNKAIRNVISKGLGDGDFDLIYSAGLFDYFSDPVAQIAGRKLFEALKPGGKLILGNFNVSNPNSLIMALALDWNLIYRSGDDLHRLFGDMGGKIEIQREDLDINIFCVISKE